MIFILGGYAQGKLTFAESLIHKKYIITNEPIPETDSSNSCDICIFNDLNTWARQEYNQNPDPEIAWEQISIMRSQYPTLILISNEIGNGIVPMDPDERPFREWMGRLQCRIAAESEEVYRVHCGIGQKIKG